MAKLAKRGHPVAPVRIEGRSITSTFWGNAWCDNLESYRDLENRLKRGRTYVRTGTVVDLQIAPREVKAMVAYIKWIGQGVKKGQKLFGSASEKLPFLKVAADPVKGQAVYITKCKICHGANGDRKSVV